LEGDEMASQANEVKAGYVLTEDGSILLQIPDPDSRWGFYLADDDQSWDGGFGVASEWELLDDSDPRITDADRERLGAILDEYR
jgi:hypothetical protein